MRIGKRHISKSKECFFIWIPLSLLMLGACSKPDTLFRLKTRTGIDFQNYIRETEAYNVLTYELVYNGGGVGVGDFNNDGLQDLYFTGNMIQNSMYLNQGNFTFKDITEASGAAAADRWSTGVTVVDINLDGWVDLYVGAATLQAEGRRRDMLFVNQGLNEDGLPTFIESAEEYGIADGGNAMHSTFFDYDNDGDLDLYVLIDQLEVFSPNKYRGKKNDGTAPTNDQLYRNDLNTIGRFTNVSQEAGIIYEGYGLGLSIVDINEDGWRDIYVSNDYLTNDLLYINQQDGTFKNEVKKYLKHQTHSAMGNDIADINNDGLPDIYTVDMLPRDNQRLKKMLLAPTYSNYINNQRYFYEPQFIRNTLQLNQGKGPNGDHVFSEVGIMAGIHATDWSWGPLLIDVDNDGFRDLIISNGFPKDITNMDYGTFRQQRTLAFDKEEIVSKLPEVEIPNMAFKNEGSLEFSNKTREWGLGKNSYSNGLAYADLDNDGDLDLVFNNINKKAFVFENQLNSSKETNGNFLRIAFEGFPQNPQGLGSKVYIYYDEGKLQYNEFTQTHGYISSSEPFVHFGLGNVQTVDSLRVIWPDGKQEWKYRVPINQVLTLQYADAKADQVKHAARKLWFAEKAATLGIEFNHVDRPFVDFNYQRLVPHQLSQRGPQMTVGDVDGNGEEDVFIGGSLGFAGTFLLQKNGKFVAKELEKVNTKDQEDMGTLLLDVEGDGDLDLYIASGSFEQAASLNGFEDRLYINDGKGNFRRSNSSLPGIIMSSSCVQSADYDKDGDPDLFVGGMLVPTQYPKPASSVILKNESSRSNPHFSLENNSDLEDLGLVNDAVWTDFNGDGWEDLIVVGEWMPLTFFENKEGELVKMEPEVKSGSRDMEIEQTTGWWNTIAKGDFDKDGDTDYLVGNHGTNSVYRGNIEEPLTLLRADFDGNGQTEGIIGGYIIDENGLSQLYPLCSKDELNNQFPETKKRFLTYASYAEAGLYDLFSDMGKSRVDTVRATWMESSYLENLGNGAFRLRALALPAQMAPIFDILVMDVDKDGNLDALLVGNDYGNNPYWGYQDAFNGLVLKGDGKGNFAHVNYTQSGFFVEADAKSMVSVKQKDGSELIFAAQNQGKLKVFGLEN